MMLLNRCFTAFALLVGCCVYVTNCQNFSVIPENNHALPINATQNVTYTCSLTGSESAVLVFWEVQGVQVQVGQMIFQGIFIEELESGVTKIIISSVARQMLEIRVRCTAFEIGPPLVPRLGPTLYIRTYGQPLPPDNLRLLPSEEPIMFAWNRSSNIPEGVEVNYTITLNSSSSTLSGVFSAINTLQVSIPFLDDVMESGRCEAFQFYVMATVADVPEGELAVAMDTVPLSANVSSINRTLRVDSVDANNGNSITAQLSFMAVEPCSLNFPIRNYTFTINGRSSNTIPATPTMTQVTGNISPLANDQQLQVGVIACSDAACRSSSTRLLNTTAVQYARVIFFENSISLTCSFASRSPAKGCVFRFQVNQNGTETEEFTVFQTKQGRQCNESANHRSGYLSISVQDLESDGVGRGSTVLAVDLVVMETEGTFTATTGCVPSVVVDSRAVSIAVPIVIVLILIALLTALAVMYLVYYQLRKKKVAKLDQSDDGDTAYVVIASDTMGMITKRDTRAVSRSLPLSALAAASINPQASLPPHAQFTSAAQTDHAAPQSLSLGYKGPPLVEVVLDHDTIRLKVNKSTLRKVALCHSIAMRRAQSEGSLTLDPMEEQSLLAQAPPSIKMTDEFKSMCCKLPRVEEEEEEELRSWGFIDLPSSFSPLPEKQ